MTDLSQTISPRSDQLNADDLIGRTLTIKITKVSRGSAEQPIAINFEGDRGKPYKPGLSMRRVLVMAWGPDGNAYVGRRLTLFRDAGVQFGGVAVGGIRISHMSDIKDATTLALTVTRGTKKPFRIQPLGPEQRTTAPGESFEDKMRARARLGTFELNVAKEAVRNNGSGAQKEFLATLEAELDAIAEAADAQENHPGADVSTDQIAAGTSDFPGDLPFDR